MQKAFYSVSLTAKLLVNSIKVAELGNEAHRIPKLANCMLPLKPEVAISGSSKCK